MKKNEKNKHAAEYQQPLLYTLKSLCSYRKSREAILLMKQCELQIFIVSGTQSNNWQINSFYFSSSTWQSWLLT